VAGTVSPLINNEEEKSFVGGLRSNAGDPAGGSLHSGFPT